MSSQGFGTDRSYSTYVGADVDSREAFTAAAATADPEKLERENLRKRAAADERVRKILDLFDGEIADVRPDERKP